MSNVDLSGKQQNERGRLRKKEAVLEAMRVNTPDSSNSTPYRSLQSLGKAVKRTKIVLPFSPRKKRAVAPALACEFGVSEAVKESCTTREISDETKENIRCGYTPHDHGHIKKK